MKYDVDVAFQKRWTINGIMNLSKVLSTPNIIAERKESFKGKTAIIVAAGPSLNYEIENVKYIKENKLAYIFAVGSAIDALLVNDIKPDACVSYDPAPNNWYVYEKLIQKKITDIPLIFGSSIGYETVQKYTGDMYHVITNQDITAQYLLKMKDDSGLGVVSDMPTVTAIAAQVLVQLGFSNILFVGQNMCYADGKTYANGIDNAGGRTLELSETSKQKLFKVKGTNNETVLTSSGFNSFIKALELIIANNKNTKWINTTKYGAAIEDAEFVPLKEYTKNNLKEAQVERDWLPKKTKEYDFEHLVQQYNKLITEYETIPNLLSKLNELSQKGSTKDINLCQKLDDVINELFSNLPFNMYFLSMFRVEFKQFLEKTKQVKNTEDIRWKNKKALLIFNNFINFIMKETISLDRYMQLLEMQMNKIVSGVKM